jgi:hypothetical protein
MEKNREFTLKIGESASLRSGFFTKTAVVFAGMPDRDGYSLVFTWNQGNAAFAYNLYFPKSRHQLTLDKKQIDVYAVSSEEIRLVIRG